METVTTACICLFTAQKSLADQVSVVSRVPFCFYVPFPFQVPPLGHIPRILARMKASNDAIPKSCVQVINVLAESEVSEGGGEGQALQCS